MLRLDLNIGGSGGNTLCSGTGVIDANGGGGYKQTLQITSTTFTDYVFNYNSLTTAQSYLMVAAIPQANSVDQTILIRKITITETPPPVTFTLPSSISLQCGTNAPQTFSVTNVYGTTGITNYTWNLGSSSNGWLYNGNPAQPTISTGNSNSISLTPVCGGVQSSVSATVTANGNQYNTNSSSVSYTQPTLSISGATEFCSGTSTYSIANLPCNASVNWSALPTGIVSMPTPSNTNPITLTQTGNGAITLKADITACGQNMIQAISINVGNPAAPDSIEIYGNGAIDRFHLCPNKTYNADAISQITGGLQYEWFLSSGYTSAQSGGLNPFLTSSFHTTFKTPASGNGYVRVRAKNGCGFSDVTYATVALNCNGGFVASNYTISPNPANNLLTIASKTNDPTIKTSNSITGFNKILFYDASNIVRKQINYPAGTQQANISLSGLKPGIYIIEIYNGKEAEYEKVIIQK